jgi:MFS family permease
MAESQLSSPYMRRAFLAAILLVVGGGLAIVAYGYWPGIMIDDARWQYQQAVDNAYEDWHPPLMAWTWRRLMFLYPGPAPMLVLQLLLYWTGILLIALWAYRRGRPRLGLALACVGWTPAPLALTGTITKDCLMAGLLSCAAGLLLWRDFARRPWLLSLAALALLLLAAALRFNAFLACVPLALAAVPRIFTSTLPRQMVTAFIAAAACVMTGPAVAALVQAEKTGVSLSLIMFDLGGITEHSGVSVFPDMDVPNPVAINHRCYDPHGWDSYSTWAKRPCPIGFDRLQSLVDDEDVDARAVWVHGIVAHPIAYVEHRLEHFNTSTFFLVRSGPHFTAWNQSVPNPWGFQVRPNPVLAAVGAITNAAAWTPLGWPIFWISLAAAALLLAVSLSLRSQVLALSASAFLYGAGYLIVGVATGMRYHLWTITGAALAAVLVAGELWHGRLRPTGRVAILAAAVVAVPTIMALLARLAL